MVVRLMASVTIRRGSYENTCYFRTDGCHPSLNDEGKGAHSVACDKQMRAQDQHWSGYLYCEDDPHSFHSTQTLAKELDQCGHYEVDHWGVVFLAAMVVAGAGYLLCGTLWRFHRLGYRLPRNRLELLPHRGLWLEVGGLVRDGVVYARRGGASAVGRRRDDRDGHRHQHRGGGGPASTAGSTAADKLSKQKHKKHKKHSKRHRSRDDLGASMLQDKETGQPTPAMTAKREWRPTVSGHLAVGARETGVKVQIT